jgi:hypothetical protein
MNLHLNYQAGCEIVKKVALDQVKMVAGNEHKLTIAYLNDKKHMNEMVL